MILEDNRLPNNVQEIKQEFYGKIDFLYPGGVGETLYYNNKDKYSKEINESNEIGRPIDANEITKEAYEYEKMTFFQSLKIEGHTNTWSAVDKKQVGNETYYLMENDEYGDETEYLIVNENKTVVVDEVYNGFEEDSFVEYIEKQKYKDTITAQLDELLDMNYITNDDYIYLKSDIDKINEEMQKYLNDNSDADMGTELDHLSNIILTTLRENTTSQKPLDFDKVVETEVVEEIQKKIDMMKTPQNQPTKLKSIVTQTYDSDPVTHVITATHPRKSDDVYNELLEYIESNEDMDFIDYVIQNNQLNENLVEDTEFTCSTNFGGSEGIYIDISYHNSVYSKHFATIKTLDDTADGFMKMSRIAATVQLLLNGNGREYELKQQHEVPIINDIKEDDRNMVTIKSPPKENFTKDQLARAKDVDLLNYVSSHYEVKPHGGTAYKIIEDGHDSVTLFPQTNSWFDYKNAVGGDIVSFLVKHEGKDLVSTVKELIGETFDPQKIFSKPKKEEIQKQPVILPDKAEDSRRVFAYLIKTRGLDRDIVKSCIDNGSIYQSKEVIPKGDKEYTFNNCIFVGFDTEKNPRYASQRSMNDDTKFVFKQDVKNSEKEYGFVLKGNDNAEWLTICEAPIDVLSIASLNKLNHIESLDEHILSLGGVTDKAIDEFLKHNDKIKVINVCLDNDEAGRSAGEKIREKYSKLGYKVVESYPKEKDYNLQLKYEIARKNQPVIDVPEHAPNNNRAFMHLTETKKLDKYIVNDLINNGSIYQSDKTILDTQGNPKTFSNTIFVQKDDTGIPVYAISVNYNASQEKADFKAEYKNDEQARSYLSQKGDSNDLLVFNNPISMLSHQTYMKEQGRTNKNNYICCISNPCEAISQFIVDNPNINDVKVMLDRAVSINPKTKQQVDFREFSYNKIKKAISSKKVSVSKKFAKGIDLNRDLQSIKSNEKSSKKEKSIENDVENER